MYATLRELSRWKTRMEENPLSDLETTAGRDLKTQELFITATWREHVVPCVR